MANLAPLWLKLRHYDDTKRLERDITQLTKSYITLKPKVNLLTYGANQINLLLLYGTLPIVYSGNTYQIPMTVIFDPPYPSQPPRCFVTPTQSMEFKKNHRYVTSSGAVCHPYLSNWDTNMSTLVELLHILSSEFSADPPVFSTANKNLTYPENSQKPANSQSYLQGVTTFLSHEEAASGPERQLQSSNSHSVTVHNKPTLQRLSSTEYRNNLRRAALDDFTCVQQHKISLQQSQEQLREISDHLRSHVIAREQMLEVLDECNAALEVANKTAMDFIAHENEVKDDTTRLYKIENMISHQMLDLTAEIAAREDLVFEYDDALKYGHKTSSEYLRGLRENFREIFMAEMLSRKIIAQKEGDALNNQKSNPLWLHDG